MTATMKITASCRYSNSCLPCLIQLAKDVTYCIGASPCRPRSQLAMWHLRSASSTSLQAQRACYRLHIGFARFTRSYYTPHRIRLSFGTQYLWCCLFYSLVVKDCQYPRDPMQPAIKKKLYSSSHSYQGKAVEAQRASNGLVKVISSKIGSSDDQPKQTASSCISPLAVLGKSLSASVLQVWFSAHWAVRVATRLCTLGETNLSIERNMSSHLSLMHAATSNFLARAWMSSTCSNVSLQFYVESFKGYFVSKLVESDSLVKTSSCPLRSSCLSLASHTFGSARLQAEKAPGLWKL